MAFGATGRNAEIPFDAEAISLSQALAKAGGLLDSRADPTGVFVLRYEPQETARQIVENIASPANGGRSPIVYQLDARSADGMFMAQQFPIFAGDVLYVSNAPASELEKGLQLMGQALSPISSSVAVYRLSSR